MAVRDSDYGAFVWSPPDPRLSRWMEIYHPVSERNGAEADAGRYLHRWVRTAGFEQPKVSSSNWTFQSAEERQWWGGLWADRVRQSEYARQSVEYGLTSPPELEGTPRPSSSGPPIPRRCSSSSTARSSRPNPWGSNGVAHRSRGLCAVKVELSGCVSLGHGESPPGNPTWNRREFGEGPRPSTAHDPRPGRPCSDG